MNNAGITSQYGFLFQRKAFILLALENIGIEKAFTFEGKDDIEITSDESIYSVKVSESNYIQVKSGTVSEECFSKVVCNWLLLDKMDSDTTILLFAENPLPDNITEDTIFDAILEGKEKRQNSIARKTYNKFHVVIENNPDSLKEQIRELLGQIRYDICSMQDLDQRMEQVFFSNYCQDIMEYDLAKSKRLERLISYINQEIDSAIKAKKSFTLFFSDLIKYIMKVREEITDHRYIAKIPELKKKFRKEATQIAADHALREVRQLYLVDHADDFVIDGIVHELIYEDFRDIYSIQKETEIINLEENAFENYKSALFALDKTEAAIPHKVYQKTVSLPIGGELIPDGPIYRKGCYVYLTRADIDPESQITWGNDHEQE
jgi:hypothetical protein